MKRYILYIFILLAAVGVFVYFNQSSYKQEPPFGEVSTERPKEVKVNPVSHASMVLEWGSETFYIDPVKEKSEFKKYSNGDFVFVTHAHPDHFDVETLQTVVASSTELIVPNKVANQLPDSFSGQVKIMNNGETISSGGFSIEAIPMYNLPQTEDTFHIKGEGNGYLISRKGTDVYIAGDTSGIEEMRSLEGVDMAFVPMNSPYTMSVQEAADAVLDFSPSKVYPYHYRNKDGSFSDVNRFEEMVESSSNVEVRLLDWYPEK